MIFFQFLFRKGKGKGSEHPNLPEWFQYSFFLFFSFTGVGFVGFPSSLVLFSFPVQIPLRYVFNMSIVLSTLCTIFSSIEKILRKNKRN